MTATASKLLTWNDIHAAKRWGTCPEPMMARFVKRRVKDGGHILDIGCGIGANAFWLAQEGYEVAAIDIAPSAVARMEERAGAELSDVVRPPFQVWSKSPFEVWDQRGSLLRARDVAAQDFLLDILNGWIEWRSLLDMRVADILSGLPWPAETFDAAVDVACLQHVEEFTAALREVRRVLKPEGRFWMMHASDQHHIDGGHGMWMRTASLSTLKAYCKGASLEVSSVETSEHTDRGIKIAHYCLECSRV